MLMRDELLATSMTKVGEPAVERLRRPLTRMACRPSPRHRLLRIFGAGMVALIQAGCVGTSGGTPVSRSGVETPASLGRERLIGRWGIASFHNDKDRTRTEGEARAQCSLPYAISPGPTNGVMMHVADDPKIYELRLKGGAAGRTYLGFEAPPGDPQDREILSTTDKMITMRFVDSETHRRYGTFVYVRCA